MSFYFYMKIVIDRVDFAYNNRKILSGFSSIINQGEILGLVGPSGVGKSTFLDLLFGYLKPDSGIITYEDEDKDADRFSILLSDTCLFPWLTIGENLKLVCDNFEDDLSLLNLKEYKDYYPKAVSVGMYQRFLLIRMAQLKAQAWLLDEPFNGLDNVTKELTKKYLLGKKEEKSIVLVSHNVDEIASFCDRVLIWNNETGNPDIEITKADDWHKVITEHINKFR